MDLDHDDYKDGDFFKEWQQIVLDTAHRIVVCDLNFLTKYQTFKLTSYSFIGVKLNWYHFERSGCFQSHSIGCTALLRSMLRCFTFSLNKFTSQ